MLQARTLQYCNSPDRGKGDGGRNAKNRSFHAFHRGRAQRGTGQKGRCAAAQTRSGPGIVRRCPPSPPRPAATWPHGASRRRIPIRWIENKPRHQPRAAGKRALWRAQTIRIKDHSQRTANVVRRIAALTGAKPGPVVAGAGTGPEDTPTVRPCDARALARRAARPPSSLVRAARRGCVPTPAGRWALARVITLRRRLWQGRARGGRYRSGRRPQAAFQAFDGA